MPAGSVVFLRDPKVKRYAARRGAGNDGARGRRQARLARGLGLGVLLRRLPERRRRATRRARSPRSTPGWRRGPTTRRCYYHLACINARAGRLDEARHGARPGARARSRSCRGGPTRTRISSRYASPGSRRPGGALAQRRDRIGLRAARRRARRRSPRPRARRRAAPARARARTPCAPARRRTGRARPAARRREHVAVGDRAHRDVGDERLAVRARDRDRERVRARERLAAVGMGQPRPATSPSARRRGRPPPAGARTSRASRSGSSSRRRRRARAPAARASCASTIAASVR